MQRTVMQVFEIPPLGLIFLLALHLRLLFASWENKNQKEAYCIYLLCKTLS